MTNGTPIDFDVEDRLRKIDSTIVTLLGMAARTACVKLCEYPRAVALELKLSATVVKSLSIEQAKRKRRPYPTAQPLKTCFGWQKLGGRNRNLFRGLLYALTSRCWTWRSKRLKSVRSRNCASEFLILNVK